MKSKCEIYIFFTYFFRTEINHRNNYQFRYKIITTKVNLFFLRTYRIGEKTKKWIRILGEKMDKCIKERRIS